MFGGGKRIQKCALVGVAQWIERQPANQRVAGLIPSQGTWDCVDQGCGPGPHLGMCERQAHSDVSVPLFLPPSPFFKDKINKILKKKKKREEE